MHSHLFPALIALSSAVVAVPSTSRRDQICGSRGYDTGVDSYYDSTKTGTYAACSKQCQKDSKCKSFAVGNGECHLYNVAASRNFEKDSDSPYAFYEASCISSTPSSITTLNPTSASTTPKSSTTTTVTKSTSASQTTTKSLTTVTTTTTRSSTSTTTTRSSSRTTTTATSTASAPPCPYPTWTITNFRYFNSSHNLDCAGTDAGNDLCATGKNPQPDGYGPPDSIAADISQIGSCAQRNPGSVPLREVGDGNVVRCAGSQIQFQFYGDSRSASSSPLFALQNTVQCDNGGSYRAYGQANLLMNCTYDISNNATCLLDRGTGTVVPTSWSA